MKQRAAIVVFAVVIGFVVAPSFAALLSVDITGYPRVTFQATGTSALTYTATNQLLSITAPPTAILFSSSESLRLISGTKNLQIRVLVDNLGNRVSGVPGDDFVLSGTVTRIAGGVTNQYSGVLLTGEVTAFGFFEAGTTDQYDFRFNPTGGALFSLFSCGDIAIQVASEASTFTGSFLGNFNGRAKGTVALEDQIPPVVTCPDNIVVECNAGSGGDHGAFVSFPNPVGTDNCGTNIVFVYSPPSGSFFPLDPEDKLTNYVVTLTATDASGKQNSCAFTVTVQDTLPPEFNDNSSPVIGECGESPFLLTTDAGQCYATFTFTKPTAVNLCCPAVHTVTISALDENGFVIDIVDHGDGTATGLFPVTCHGTNLLIVVAADDRGNTGQHQCPILVVDSEPPVITCSSTQVVECTGGPVFYEEPSVLDNCPNFTLSCTPTNGSLLGLGTHAILCTAADCSGHTNQCTFDVTVQDTTPPTLSCPSDITIECDQSAEPSVTGTATASDVCDSAPTVTFSDTVSVGWPRIISRSWKAMDAMSNSVTCVQTITVRDGTPPAISCPADKQLQCGDSTAPSNTGVATATDSCDTNVAVSYTDAATPANCTGKAGIDRTWKAMDSSGNIATCVQHLTFVDSTPPTITAVPAGVNLGCNPATLPSDSSVKQLVSATDNCGAPVISVSHVDAISSCAVTRTFTATAFDGCGNAAGPQVIVYTWTADTIPPSVTVPAGGNLGCNPASLPTDASVKALVTATDDCGTPVVNVSHVDANNGCAVTRTFTVTASDGCGNASLAQTVVYTWTADTTPPTITCPAAITVSSVPAPNPSGVTASDNCDGTITKSFVSDSVVTNGCQIVVTRTYKVTDACGNSATGTQTITVAPLISPTDCILWHAPLANSPANDDTDPSRINGQVSGTKYKYVFKGGSTIPIQVRVNGCGTGDATMNPNVVAVANVYADQNCDTLPDGNALDIDYNGVGDAGGVMDNVGGFKKYNLDTKTLTTPGCYVLEIVVTDASTGQSCKERVLLQRR